LWVVVEESDPTIDVCSALVDHGAPAALSAGEDGAAVDVEDFAGDEAGEWGAEEEDGAGDLGDVGGAADGDGGVGAGGDFGEIEDGAGHLGVGPAGGYAVGVDAVGCELGGEGFGEGDDGAFAGGVVGVAAFSALAGGGGDEDDVASSGLEGDAAGGKGLGIWWWFIPKSQRRDPGHPRAGEHVGGGGVDEAEDGVDVGGLGETPLGGGHGGDGGFDGGPDAVVGDEDIEIAEVGDGAGNQGFAFLGCGEGRLDGQAEGGAAEFDGEGFGLGLRGDVAEGDAGSGLAEEADGGCADAAGASGDEGGAAGEGEGDPGGRVVRRGVCWWADGGGLIFHSTILHQAADRDIALRGRAVDTDISD
jgi:hypothetical protein